MLYFLQQYSQIEHSICAQVLKLRTCFSQNFFKLFKFWNSSDNQPIFLLSILFITFSFCLHFMCKSVVNTDVKEVCIEILVFLVYGLNIEFIICSYLIFQHYTVHLHNSRVKSNSIRKSRVNSNSISYSRVKTDSFNYSREM